MYTCIWPGCQLGVMQNNGTCSVKEVTALFSEVSYIYIMKVPCTVYPIYNLQYVYTCIYVACLTYV